MILVKMVYVLIYNDLPPPPPKKKASNPQPTDRKYEPTAADKPHTWQPCQYHQINYKMKEIPKHYSTFVLLHWICYSSDLSRAYDGPLTTLQNVCTTKSALYGK